MARPSILKQEIGKNISGIYGLVFDNEIKYIGQSKDIRRRYKQHCLLSNNQKGTKKTNFFRKKLKAGQCPQLTIIEQTKNLNEREIFWIEKIKPPLNISQGGQIPLSVRATKKTKPWGQKWSPIQKRMISLKQTKKMFERKNDSLRVKKVQRAIDKLQSLIDKLGRDTVNKLLYSIDTRSTGF